MKNVSNKTTAAGIVTGGVIVGLIVAKVLKLLTIEDFVTISGTVTAFALALIGILSKDSDKTGLPNQ